MKLPYRKLLALIVVPMFYGCIHSSDQLSDIRDAFRKFQPNETILRQELTQLSTLQCYMSVKFQVGLSKSPGGTIQV